MLEIHLSRLHLFQSGPKKQTNQQSHDITIHRAATGVKQAPHGWQWIYPPPRVNLGGWMLKTLVVPLPCVESWSNSLRSPVVHIYKSHHQLSEHLQPPLPHQTDGEMEEKSMASSSERSTSVMFGSLMLPSPTLSPLWEIEILSLNKLTDVNRLESSQYVGQFLSAIFLHEVLTSSL